MLTIHTSWITIKAEINQSLIYKCCWAFLTSKREPRLSRCGPKIITQNFIPNCFKSNNNKVTLEESSPPQQESMKIQTALIAIWRKKERSIAGSSRISRHSNSFVLFLLSSGVHHGAKLLIMLLSQVMYAIRQKKGIPTKSMKIPKQ